MAFHTSFRPTKLSELVGQTAAVKTVRGFIDKGAPPTVLFYGPHSTGKTTLARILGRALNCTGGDVPCGECPSCQVDPHPDIIELNAADARGIETIRRIDDIGRLRPQFTHRVIILDEAHALTPQAYQASLKVFEEPPKTTTFVLVTTDSQKIPQTIRSRCSPVPLMRLKEGDLMRLLARVAKWEGLVLTKEQAQELARASMGHPREALVFLEQVAAGGQAQIEERLPEVVRGAPELVAQGFVDAMLKRDVKACVKLVDKIEDYRRFTETLVVILQLLLRVKVGAPIDPAHKRRLQNFKVGDIDMVDIEDCLFLLGTSLTQQKTFLLDPDVSLDLAVMARAAG